MTDSTGIGDFIFGTLTSTADRLESVISNRRGLNAPTFEMRDGITRLTLTAGPETLVESVTLYFTTDGSDPTPGAAGTTERAFQEYAPIWDTLLWGYLRRFEATIPPSLLPAEGILRYRAEGVTRAGETIPAAHGQRFSQLLMSYPIPAWVADAVIYHIFVDRFSPESGKAFATHTDLAGFFGGTLRGITEQLDYIADLGATVIWLSPIFPSPSHHGYDVTDYMEIEPRLGTKADLKALVQAAHGRGIRILLDFVPSHLSDEHPFFKSAATDPDSPYRDYFTFTNWPDDYKAFFGVKSLPSINSENPDARRHLIDSAVYWMREFDVDGFRLDYAYAPSHDFWADFYAAVKAINPEAFTVGEIVETPELLRSYEGRMTGTLDFHFLQAIRKTLVYDTMTIEQFDDWLHRHQTYFNKHNIVLPTFLDNHDMNRFLWAAKGDKRRLRLAALLQFTLPAPPIIYYGTEVGMSQLRDIRQNDFGILEEARLPMPWDAIDDDMLAYYKRLIAIRREIGGALNGSRQTLLAESSTGRYSYGYYAEAGGRFDGELAVLVLLNHSAESRIISLDTPGQWRDLFTGKTYPDGQPLSVALEPYSGTVLVRA